MTTYSSGYTKLLSGETIITVAQLASIPAEELVDGLSLVVLGDPGNEGRPFWYHYSATKSNAASGVDIVVPSSGVGRWFRGSLNTDSAVAIHEAKSNPHPQYISTTTGDNRYRLVNAPILESEIPASIARDSEVNSAIAAISPGTIGAEPTFSILPVNKGGTGASTASQARVNLGAQPLSSELSGIGDLASTGIVSRTGIGTYTAGSIGDSNISSVSWAKIQSTPTSLSGYGITDAAPSSHSHTIESLIGVTITLPVTGQVLQYNGTKWVNVDIPSAPVQSVFGRTGVVSAEAADYSSFYASSTDSRLTDSRTPTDGSVTNAKVATNAAIDWSKISKLGASEFASSSHNHTIGSLSGIALTSPTNGQVLQFNGTNWVNFSPNYLTGNQSITLSGAITGSGTTAITTALSSTGIVAGTFTKLTIGEDGRATAGTTLTQADIPSLNWAKITNTPTTLVGYGITDAAISTHNHALSTLTETNIVNPSIGQLLRYSGTNWVNFTPNYLTGNQSITLSGDISGSGATAISTTLANSGVTAGTYQSVSVDAKGRVTAGTGLVEANIPQLGWTKITSTPTTLSGYGITDAASATHNHTFSTLNGVTLTSPTNGQILQFNGTSWINAAAPSSPVQSVFGRTGAITASASDYSAFYPSNTDSRLSDNRTPTDASVTNTKVATNAAIAWSKIDKTGATEFASNSHNHAFGTLTGISLTSPTNGQLLQFNGTSWVNFTPNYLTGNQSITLSGDISGGGTTAITATLANSGVTAGTYQSVTVDAKGRVIAGTNSTTLAGYGITDAALSTHNHALNSLNGVSIATPSNGQLLQFNGVNWVNFTPGYLTNNQPITLSGDISGSGTTAITATLSNTGVTANTYRSVTVDTKGRVTAGSNPTTLAGYGITDAALSTHNHTFSTLTGVSLTSPANGQLLQFNGTSWTNFTPNYLTGNQSITLSGDISGSGATAITATLANSGVAASTYRSVTVDAKGRVTAGTNPTTLAGYGITDAALSTHNHTLNSLTSALDWNRINYDSTGWTSPTYNTGWAASADTPISYKKLSNGLNLLFIVGAARYTLTSGSYFDAIFTLPVGSRTSNNRYLVGTLIKDGNLGTINIRIASDGRLLVYLTASPTAQEIWLDCVIHL